MKKSPLIIIIAIIVLSIGTFIYFKYDLEGKEKIYVLYDPVKERKLDWVRFEHLLPADFEPKKTIVEIGELLKLNEQQREIYDSIINNYYSQLNLKKEVDGNGFYLSLNPTVSIFYEKTESSRQIPEDKVSDYDPISLDSLVKITPGLEYYELKIRNKVEAKEKYSIYIIEIIPKSDLVQIHKIRPILEEYE